MDDEAAVEPVAEVLAVTPPPVPVGAPMVALLQATARLPVHTPAKQKNLSRCEITIRHHLAWIFRCAGRSLDSGADLSYKLPREA